MGVIGQVSFFVALIFVIVIHEAAHFGVAKAFGIKVTEFFVGFGPRIWSTKRGDTEYGFKWIPAGGYVKIAGMNPYEQVTPEDLPRTYGAKPAWQRALVIVAGPATHFVLAFLCFAIWLGFVGEPRFVDPVIERVPQELGDQPSPAFIAGLRRGDVIVGVDGISHPSTEQLLAFTQQHVGEAVTITVRRDGRTVTTDVVPVPSTIQGERIARIGVVLRSGRELRETRSVVGAISGGAALVGESAGATVDGVVRVFGPSGIQRVIELVFTDAPRTTGDPASVVGVGRVAGDFASRGDYWDILSLFGYVNVFVGLLNLLPLPPFDGGHLAVLVLEKIRGKPVDMRKVVPISAVVAAFFILFTVAVVYVDLVKPPSF
jgi:membrane-associated protease RseP (regulator of RpoE activity)